MHFISVIHGNIIIERERERERKLKYAWTQIGDNVDNNCLSHCVMAVPIIMMLNE